MRNIITIIITMLALNANATVTFDDVRPILQKNCTSCHPGASSYDVAYGMKDKIYQLFIVEGKMPPKHRFQPTASEKELVKKWIDQGAKK